MALPAFVRDQMLGLDDAARLRQALRDGDWWQVSKSSAAIAYELGGTASLVGFPIMAGIGYANRRLGSRALAAVAPTPPATPPSSLPGTVGNPFVAPPPFPTPSMVAPPRLAPLPGTVGNPFVAPVRPATAPPVRPSIPVRRPGLAPGAGLAGLAGRAATQAFPSELVRPTVPVPQRPFIQQAFPVVSEAPAAGITAPSGIRRSASGFEVGADGGVTVDDIIARSREEAAAGLPRRSPSQIEADILAERAAGARPDWPATYGFRTPPPSLDDVVRRPPGMNPQRRGIATPGMASIRQAPFAFPNIGGGMADTPPIPLRRNVQGAPTGPTAPRKTPEQEALDLAGRIARGEQKPVAGLRGAVSEPVEEAVEDFVRINLDETVDEKFVTSRLLRDAGVRTRAVDQYGNPVDAPMSPGEYFSLPRAEQDRIGVDLEAVRKAPSMVEYMRTRGRQVTPATREDATVAQSFWPRDPKTGKPKTGRAPGYMYGDPGQIELELDTAIRAIGELQYSTGALGSGQRTGSLTMFGGLDTKIARESTLASLNIPGATRIAAVTTAPYSRVRAMTTRELKASDSFAVVFTDQVRKGGAKPLGERKVYLPIVRTGYLDNVKTLRSIRPGKFNVELMSDATLADNIRMIDEALSQITPGSQVVIDAQQLDDAAGILFADAPQTWRYYKKRLSELSLGSKPGYIEDVTGAKTFRPDDPTLSRPLSELLEYVRQFGGDVVDPAYYMGIPGIEKALANATPEQAEFIKRYGAKRYQQIVAEGYPGGNLQVLTLLRHNMVGGYLGGTRYSTGVIAVPRTLKLGPYMSTLKIPKVNIRTGESLRGGQIDFIDLSTANAFENDLITKEFADIINAAYDRSFAAAYGATKQRGLAMGRPTPLEASEERIARGRGRQVRPEDEGFTYIGEDVPPQ